MRTPTSITTAVVLTVVSVSLVVPAAARTPGLGPDLQPVDGPSWEQVIDRSVRASGTTAYEAMMVVVALGPDGPAVTEVELRRGRDGELSVERSEAWLIASDEHATMFRDEQADRLLRIGRIHALPFATAQVDRTYRVEVAGRADLATGPALAVAFSRRGVLRERLFVDRATDLVVRRETYGRDGEPVRVTALTDLEVRDTAMAPMDTDGAERVGPRTPMAPREVAELAGHEWPVPTAVGDAFDLRAGYRLDDEDAVQLVYSDGLYTISVLEQPGHLAGHAVADAAREVHDGIAVYRWVGTEPLRLVWTGDGHTFTAVTDAPMDVMMDVVADLPHDASPSMPSRLGRGLTRLGSWLWPFD